MTRSRTLVLAALLLGGCGREGGEAPKVEASAGKQVDPFAEPERATTTHPLLAWIDPDAVAAVYTRVDPSLDLEAFAALFAVPPRAVHMLRDLRAFDDGLAALLTGSGPPPSAWLTKEAVVMMAPSGQAPYLVRGLTRPRAEVEAWLQAAGMQRETIEGMAVWAPLPGPDADAEAAQEVGAAAGMMAAAAFPWRLVFLDDTTVGGMSLKELGTGLGPLTAARDLPASELEKEWTRLFRDDAELVLEMYAGGPMLSLDMTDDVARTHLSIRRWQQSGLDGSVELVPIGDDEAMTRAAAELEARSPEHETDVIRELYGRAAFTVEGPTVRGRLQLSAEDLAPLRRAGAG